VAPGCGCGGGGARVNASNVRTPEELAAEQRFIEEAEREAAELAEQSLTAAIANAGGTDASA